MPKQTKSKKIVSSKGSRKFSTPVGVLFAVGIGLVLAVAGTYGYTKYKERDLQAKANRWKTFAPFSKVMGAGDGVKFVGCKEYTTIGPDQQTGKKMKVNILASKPKTLMFNTNTQGKNKQPQFYVENFTPQELSQAFVPTGGAFSVSWWGGELAAFSLNNVTQGDEIMAYVVSDAGIAASFGSSSLLETDATKRVYHSPPHKNTFKTDKEYTNAMKTWKKQTISATQLPNCN